MDILGLVDIPLYLLLAVVAAILLYLYGTWGNNFFKKQGIPGPAPYPFIGNSTEVGFMQNFQKWKETYGNVFGIFMGREPVFVVSDMDILKEVLVKSFNNFRNRRRLLLVAKPFNLGVFFLEDSAWKRVRNIISPTFSGGKLRLMCSAINDCAKTLTKNFAMTLNKKDLVDMKEYFGAYTMDVIAQTAFGVQVDSQTHFDHPFVVNAKKIFQSRPTRQPLLVLANAFPSFAKLLNKFNVSFFPNEVIEFFDKNVAEIIRQRQADSRDVAAKRTDFLQLLIDAEIEDNSEGHVTNGDVKSGNQPERKNVRRLTVDEIVGQGILFFIAGYETTATTLNFASYSLATNPDVQEKAYQEIKEIIGDADPTYDNIGNLKYLDNVVMETLRMYPPVISLHRRAAETINIKGITIPKDSTVFIPTLAIHMDPTLFDEPEKFKPERRNEKGNGPSFLSFGYGPRICIGMRLALVEAKIALVYVLRKFRLERVAETPEKLTFKRSNLLQPTVPNMLKLVSRD